MPLTHVTDPRKEKKNVNSAIYPPPMQGLPGTREEVLPSRLWPGVQMEEN